MELRQPLFWYSLFLWSSSLVFLVSWRLPSSYPHSSHSHPVPLYLLTSFPLYPPLPWTTTPNPAPVPFIVFSYPTLKGKLAVGIANFSNSHNFWTIKYTAMIFGVSFLCPRSHWYHLDPWWSVGWLLYFLLVVCSSCISSSEVSCM